MISLTKNPITVNEAAASRVCRDALEEMGPRFELRTALTHLDHTTAPLVPAGTFRNRLADANLI